MAWHLCEMTQLLPSLSLGEQLFVMEGILLAMGNSPLMQLDFFAVFHNQIDALFVQWVQKVHTVVQSFISS